MQNSNEVLRTAVLVIGQSGVGKSSLLNYMFGKEVEKTGAGAAVTKEGIYNHEYKYDDNFIIDIHDTWGLEPSQTDKWENLIKEQIKLHDQKSINEWFNTIIFCISASSDRVQDFEVKIIEELIADKCNIVVAVTNCRSEDYSPAIIMKHELIERTQISDKNIVFVNSVSKKLIGNKSTIPTFGREKIFTGIIRNLWNTFKYKVPDKAKKDMVEREKLWAKAEYKKIDKMKFLLFKKNRTVDTYVEEINRDFENHMENEIVNVNTDFKNAIEYYNKLSKKFVEIGFISSSKYISDPEFSVDIRRVFSDKVDKTLDKMFSNKKKLVELMNTEIDSGRVFKDVLKTTGVELGMFLSNTRLLKKNLKEATRLALVNFNVSLVSEIEKFEKYVQSLDIERAYLEQVKNFK